MNLENYKRKISETYQEKEIIESEKEKEKVEEQKMTLIEVYDKAFENIEREGKEEFLNWLKNETDFFEAPASTNFHSNFKGGLALHSINVYKILRNIMNTPWMKELILKDGKEYSEETLAIVSLLHDVCKANNYIYKPNARKYKDDTLKNKNGYPGVWFDLPGYEVNKENTLPGHGELSVFMISQYMRLTMEESIAIRYHMGLYEGESKMREIAGAFSNYPLAFALHLADDMAGKFMEKTITQEDKVKEAHDMYIRENC